MKKSNHKLNLEALLCVYNQQTNDLGGVNREIYCDYLSFRKTQWKKCNTTLNNIIDDNLNQYLMLLEGNIHIKLFYRSIQFAIYHEINTTLIKQNKLVKPQKIANLTQEISYFDIFELSKTLSQKLGIVINPVGVIKLTEIYLECKSDETKEAAKMKLQNLNINDFNKATAKGQEISFDYRMNLDCCISLKILHLAIQYLCVHWLEPQILELNELIDFNIAKVHLNSCSHMNRDFEVSYNFESVAALFSCYLNEIAEEAMAA